MLKFDKFIQVHSNVELEVPQNTLLDGKCNIIKIHKPLNAETFDPVLENERNKLRNRGF